VHETRDNSRRKLSRRGLMGATFGVALFGASYGAGRGLRSFAALSRPGPASSRARRCGQCGSPDHAMLSAACPVAPGVI
jgi:hypothetical protein